MQVILDVASAMGLILGSLATAGLLCWLLWDAGKFFRHPEWVAWAILALLTLSLAGKLPNSEFAHLVLLFTLVAALPLWFAGRASRRQIEYRKEVPQMQRSRLTETNAAIHPNAERRRWSYPVITACLSEGRAPTHDERHLLARRLWREALARHFGSASTTANFAERRILSRATDATLRGKD